jgi:hypothetical protein
MLRCIAGTKAPAASVLIRHLPGAGRPLDARSGDRR